MWILVLLSSNCHLVVFWEMGLLDKTLRNGLVLPHLPRRNFTFYIRGMLGTLFLIHCLKILQPFSKHPRNQQVSAYNRSFLIIIQSHGCKKILFSLLNTKKIADAILLYVDNVFNVFNTGFSASLFRISKHTQLSF